jgi:non-specific serine/threonine protein kinase
VGQQGVAALDGTGNDEQEMILRNGLGQALMFTDMTSAARVNLTRALSIAESGGNTEYQKRVLHGLWWFSVHSMELRKALQLGRRYAEFTRGDTDATMHTSWICTPTDSLWAAKNVWFIPLL